MNQQEYLRAYYVREYCCFYANDIFITITSIVCGKEKQCSFARLSEREKEEWIMEWSKILKDGGF